MNSAPFRRVCWLAVLLLVAPALAQTPAQTSTPTFPNPGKTSMTKENQHALGMQVAEQVYKEMPVLPDNSPETVYIRKLGRKLVDTIPSEYSWPFEFHVIPQKEINAFALPGGQMFVNVGTITAAKSEAELAGVMGHEMAHVYMQHSAKQAGKAQTTGLIAGIASAVLGETVGSKAGGLVGGLGQMGIQMTAEGMMLKYSRSDESQADAVGTIILYKAGYNPQAMADFFMTLAGENKDAPPVFFSSHPNPQNRHDAIQKEIANWPPQTYSGDSAEFTAEHQHAATLKVYTAKEIQQGAKSGQWAQMNKRNGAVLNGGGESGFPTKDAIATPSPVSLQKVLPAGRMVNANLGPMSIQRPENWNVSMPDQQGQFVTIAPEAGVTTHGVGYGVLLNSTAAPARKMSVDDMTAALIAKIKESNELEQTGKSQSITVAGVDGRATMLESPSPFPDAKGDVQKEGDWLITVPRRDGSMIFMIFVAPANDFGQFKPTFEAMVKSVQLK